MKDKIKFTNSIVINKPLQEVYNSFIDNEIICSYFTTNSSAPIKRSGETIKWKWNNDEADIFINEVVENKTVSFSWKGYKVDYNIFAVFDFLETDGKTIVKVTEMGWNKDDAGIASSHANCSGWQDMLCCMKAWIEYKIDLR